MLRTPVLICLSVRRWHWVNDARVPIILSVRSVTWTGGTHAAKGSTMKVAMTNALPRKSTVVYDGQCSFCRRWVARIARRYRNDALEFVARQTKGLTKRFPRLVEGDFNTGMRLITPDDAIHVGADAAYQIACHLRYWRWIAWLYHVPGIHSLTRALYAHIAANRQSQGGRCDDGTCKPV